MTKFKPGDRVLVTARFCEEDVEMIKEPCEIIYTDGGYHTMIVLDFECEAVQE